MLSHTTQVSDLRVSFPHSVLRGRAGAYYSMLRFASQFSALGAYTRTHRLVLLHTWSKCLSIETCFCVMSRNARFSLPADTATPIGKPGEWQKRRSSLPEPSHSLLEPEMGQREDETILQRGTTAVRLSRLLSVYTGDHTVLMNRSFMLGSLIAQKILKSRKL